MYLFYQMFRKAPCYSSGDVRNGFACSILIIEALGLESLGFALEAPAFRRGE